MRLIQRETLVLASGSPRRRRLLETVGLSVELKPAPSGVEPDPNPGEDPARYAERAALAKASAVSAKGVILAADTVVALGRDILGKPKNAADALWMLSRLCGVGAAGVCPAQGVEHTVNTAFVLIRAGETLHIETSTSTVRMVCPDFGLLKAYAASEEPRDKAGAYALQGAGGFLVRSVRGSTTGVIGLPLAETVAALVQLGIVAAV